MGLWAHVCRYALCKAFSSCAFAQGPDFVMLCSDTAAAHSIISIKQDEDKLVPLDSHKLLGIAGEAGDRVNFSEYIIANAKLYALRNNTELTTKSVAHFTRGELARALRSVSAQHEP
jgi:20S proteasome subunit beta 4